MSNTNKPQSNDYLEYKQRAEQLHKEAMQSISLHDKPKLAMGAYQHLLWALEALEAEHNARPKPQLTPDDKPEAVWEVINETYCEMTERMPVPGGWMVKTTLITVDNEQQVSIAMCFIPDLYKDWLKGDSEQPPEPTQTVQELADMINEASTGAGTEGLEEIELRAYLRSLFRRLVNLRNRLVDSP